MRTGRLAQIACAGHANNGRLEVWNLEEQDRICKTRTIASVYIKFSKFPSQKKVFKISVAHNILKLYNLFPLMSYIFIVPQVFLFHNNRYIYSIY
jgi:hypothetical protein